MNESRKLIPLLNNDQMLLPLLIYFFLDTSYECITKFKMKKCRLAKKVMDLDYVVV
jgi:hypothetical protein